MICLLAIKSDKRNFSVDIVRQKWYGYKNAGGDGVKNIRGIAASNGIAIGKLCVRRSPLEMQSSPVTDVRAEIQRLYAARTAAERNISRIYRQALQKFGTEDSLIFKSHIILLEDHDFFEDIQNNIVHKNMNAESAVWMTAQHFYRVFSEMEDEYMRARDTDILDIARHLLRYLNPTFEARLNEMDEKGIVAVDELLPSEAVTVNRRKVFAFISQKGSRYSHAAILLRSAGIPFVVGLGEGFEELDQVQNVIVDGSTGDIVLNPDTMAIKEYCERQNRYLQHRNALREFCGCPSVTQDGYSVGVYASIGHAEDVRQVMDNDADGIGLMRTEFLYLGSDIDSSEEGQFQAYKTVLEKMQGKRVVIRTLDVSEEPEVSQWRYGDPVNPAMGFRAIRFSLRRPDLFLTQLRAILRASIYGKVAIMFPVVTSVQEIIRAKELVYQERDKLLAEDIPVANKIELGAMIETPAAVMLSDLLAQYVDFFSIGTNDLTQYTLAADRMNDSVASLYNPSHPAVLRMIHMAVENAKKHGVRTSICGVSASDPELLPFYLAIGADELSVSPSLVLEMRKMVRQTILGQDMDQIIHKFCNE